MIFSGLMTACGLVAIAAKFSPTFLKKLLGYDWLIDLIITLGIPLFMGGTHIGIMTGIITGLSVSLILYFAKNLMGYQKLEKGIGFFGLCWSTKPGIWTTDSIGKFMAGIYVSLKEHPAWDAFVGSYKEAYSQAAVNTTATVIGE